MIQKHWNPPVRMWARSHGSWCTRFWCRATHSRRALDYGLALHYCRTSNQTRAPWISRKGLLWRTGFLQLLAKKKHIDQRSPAGGTNSQLTATHRLNVHVIFSDRRGAVLPEQVAMWFQSFLVDWGHDGVLVPRSIWSPFTSSTSPSTTSENITKRN